MLMPAGRPPHGGLVELENCGSLAQVLVPWEVAARMRTIAPRGFPAPEVGRRTDAGAVARP
jgi:hypothetical protein